MRTLVLVGVLVSIASCYVQTPPPNYGSQPGYGPSSLSGRWEVTAIVPPGQPFPGTYTTAWEITDSGGHLFASSVWSNGARSRYTGWVRGNTVHIDRTDDSGFRSGLDGTVSADGALMNGGGQNDPTSPGGNTATYNWSARRITTGPVVVPSSPPPASSAPPATPAPAAPPPSAPTANLSGRWQLSTTVPPGQPFPGTYTSTCEITDVAGRLSGSGVWSNGTRSRYMGWVSGNGVHIERVDDSGFRGSFDGSIAPSGEMSGSGRNDPTSPGGNNAAYTWTARRM